MTLTDEDVQRIRSIVRQELRREQDGIRCPKCGAKQMSAAEWDDLNFDSDEFFGCGCGFDARASEFLNAEP